MGPELRTRVSEVGGGELSGARARALPLAALPYLVLVGCVLVVYGRTLSLGILGHDSYSLIETARVQSFADFVGLVTEKFMDGHFREDFYRPVLSMSLALDWALSGLSPLGYQIDHLVMFAATCCALYALLWRSLGRRAPALLGALAFLVFPAHWEVIPVVCRRQDMLATLFALLAAWAAIEPASLARARPRALVGLFTLLAVASKETGALALPLVAVAAFAHARSGHAHAGNGLGVPARVRAAVAASVPALVAIGLYTLARRAVLGSVASYAEGSPFGWRAALFFLRRVFVFDPALEGAHTSAWPVWGGALALAFAFVVALLAARPRASSSTPVRAPRASGAFALGVAWIAAVASLMAWVGPSKVAPWHAFFPVAGAGLAVGALAAALLAAWSARRVPRALLVASVLPLAWVAWGQAKYSLPFGRADQWQTASDRGTAFLAELSETLRTTPDGACLQLEVPVRGVRAPGELGTRRPSILAGHSVASWVRMAFPARKVLVGGGMAAESSIPDGIVLSLDVAVLDWSGPPGHLRRMLEALAAERGLRDPDQLDIQGTFAEQGPSGAKARLLDLVLASKADKVERLVVLTRYFESIGALAAARRSLSIARTEAPEHPLVRAALRDLGME